MVYLLPVQGVPPDPHTNVGGHGGPLLLLSLCRYDKPPALARPDVEIVNFDIAMYIQAERHQAINARVVWCGVGVEILVLGL